MRKLAKAITWQDIARNTALTRRERAYAELHGDQLYSWFREKFKGHKDALNKRECRAMFAYALQDAR